MRTWATNRSCWRTAAYSHPTAVFAIACAFLLSGGPRNSSADPLFASYLSFDTGKCPQSVAMGDLNGDGKIDLAVANSGSNTVSVLFGNGDGSFAPRLADPLGGGFQNDFRAGSLPLSVAIGDLNGDGEPDLAVASAGSNNVSILLNGQFWNGRSFGILADPYSVAIGDLNGDGKPDLAVANRHSTMVSVLLGNGDGSFGAQRDFGAGTAPYSVAIGDLNGDGRPDLAAANAISNTVSVLLGNGDGSFSPQRDFGPLTTPTSVAIGDLNGDGRPDLAAANAGSTTVSVLLGNGDGSFAAPRDFGNGRSPYSIAIGDLNGDGKLDLAVVNAGSNMVSVLVGNGDGSFGAQRDFRSGFDPYSVAIGDLNGDGKPDLALTDCRSAAVDVVLGKGDGSFVAQRELGAGTYPISVAIGDLSGDGKPDLAVANTLSHTISVLLGNGDGTFVAKGDFGCGSYPYCVAIGDLNGDGKPDLAVANDLGCCHHPNTVSVLFGNGDGSFGARRAFETGSHSYSVAIGDLNADGKLDLAVANNDDNTVSVLLGNDDGTFDSRRDFGTWLPPYSVAIGDLNGDGKADLVVPASVWLGNGDGTFGPRRDFGSGWVIPTWVAIGDLNGDGKPDLAVADVDSWRLVGDQASWRVWVLLGNGDGTFEEQREFGVGKSGISVAIGDLNGDGKPDLAVGNASSATVSVLLGNGDGSFGAKSDFGTGDNPYSIAIGDLNSDGKADLAVANVLSNTVSVLLNSGGSVPTPTLLSFFRASWTSRGIELRWQFGEPKSLIGAALERGNTEGGPWIAVEGELQVEGEAAVIFDRNVVTWQTYYYRLVTRLRNGDVITFGPLMVAARMNANEFVLLSVTPNPSRGLARVEFAVPREARVRLSVLDVYGRLVSVLADGMHQPGLYQAAWGGATGRGPAAAGLYFVRLEAPGKNSVRRIVLAR